MEEVERSLEGNLFSMKVDLPEELGPSASVSTIMIALPGGNATIPGHEEARVELNVYRQK